MNKYVIIFILVIFFSNGNIFSQNKEIGVDIGYGISEEYYDNFLHIINPQENYNYFRFGFNYYQRPPEALFTIKTGLIYDFRKYNMVHYNYLKTPIGLDFIIGKKLNFIFGGGFYISYLFLYNEKESIPVFEKTNSRFLLGCEANLGFGYQISEKIKVCLMCQINNDITKMYKYKRSNLAGGTSWDFVRGVDGFCKLGIKYSINKK